MDEQNLKTLFENTFDTIAEGYDNSAMRFFPESASRISSFLNLNGNEHILDVATGTGIAALTVVDDLPQGYITGIDFSKGILSCAKRKKDGKNTTNVSFIKIDMQSLDFPDHYFDVAMNTFGIFFVDDMEKQLNHMTDKVKHGGKVVITTFHEDAFSPLVNLFLDHLQRYDIKLPTLAWKRVATKEQCTTLFRAAELKEIRTEIHQCGYYLKKASDRWHIIWNGGFRGLVNQLFAEALIQFRDEHCNEVQELATNEGIWLEMGIIYTVGTKKSKEDQN